MIFNSSSEGSCLLYDGITGHSIFGIDPKKRAEKIDGLKNAIGYLAYPNPTLKNDIPDARFYEYDRLITYRLPLTAPQGSYLTSGKLEQSVTKAKYVQKIREIKALLSAGEVYQINYAIRFRKKFSGDPFAFFHRFSQTNPAAFAAYLNCGDFHIISASPERLFKVAGNTIITQPIKGTAPKSGGQASLQALLASAKERAELDMITDLERNDIGKICEYGTLKLTKERAVMELPNLWHTTSEVRGKLPKNLPLSAMLSALFPGGSITGCPKLRAMEYIEQLEHLSRNIFTGSIGYVQNKFTADFNIAIRTALIHHGWIEYWAGGGIVYDSDPEKEYEECLLKAEKFLRLIE